MITVLHHLQKAENKSLGPEPNTTYHPVALRNPVHKSYEQDLWQSAALVEANSYWEIWFTAGNPNQALPPIAQGQDHP